MAKTIGSFYDNPLYQALNNLFSANYMCLKTQNDISPFIEGGGIINARDLFSKSKSPFGKDGEIFQAFLKNKLVDCVNFRNNYISIIQSGIDKEKVEEPMTNMKKSLIDAYNIAYDSNKKFEEVFKNYTILDQRFFDDFMAAKNNEPTSIDSDTFNSLCDVYAKYLYLLEDYMAYESFRDIYRALCDDISSQGYRTIFYNKPQNNNIQLVYIEEIENLFKMIYPVFSYELSVVNELEKYLKKLLKEINKKNNPNKVLDTNTYNDYYNEYQIHITKLASLQQALDLVDALKERFVSANSEHLHKKYRRFEKIMMFMSGVSKDENQELYIDKIYVHDNELLKIISLMMTHEGLKEFAEGVKNNFYPPEENTEKEKNRD